MKHRFLLGLATVAAATGITAGIVRAQSTVDQPVTTADVTTVADAETAPSSCLGHKQARLDGMAKQFGMSVEDLQKELDAGKLFYQIAAEHGWTYAKMHEQRTTDMKATLDDMVNVGYMTQDEANAVFERMQAHMNEMPMMGLGFGHHGRWKR